MFESAHCEGDGSGLKQLRNVLFCAAVQMGLSQSCQQVYYSHGQDTEVVKRSEEGICTGCCWSLPLAIIIPGAWAVI